MNENGIHKDSRSSVLIIDDEENMRHMLASMLKRSGYVVQTAIDGETGIEELKRSQNAEYGRHDLFENR